MSDEGNQAPIALTLGDPSGIGVEIALKALWALPEALRARVRLYGHAPLVEAQRRALAGVSDAPLDGRPARALAGVDEACSPGALGVVETTPGPALSVTPGVADATAARVQRDALLRAIDDAQAGRVAAIVTAPWTKHILGLLDGVAPTGHTEVLGARTGTARPVMLLAGEVLRVALVTAHLPLRAVADAVTGAGIEHVIEVVAEAGRREYGLARPRIAVCGLNPHAGERGVLGHEEEAIIAPALARARARLGARAEVRGPEPADALFARVVRDGSADFVVAMYHDQGLGPLKLWHSGEAANVTLGLPFVRTSVDHGAAHDIAGRGVARADSLCYATALAATLAARRAAAGG